LLRVLLLLAAGVALGLWSAEAVLRNGPPFGVAAAGPWRLETRAGVADADPYTRAELARGGEIPLALGEGLQLVARVDDDGAKLDSRCVYSLGPRVPPARFWTLEIADRDGYPLDNPDGRTTFRSGELLRSGDGAFTIRIGAQVQPGNWLPVGAKTGFELVLRLYDTPLSAVGDEIQRSAVPRILRERCS